MVEMIAAMAYWVLTLEECVKRAEAAASAVTVARREAEVAGRGIAEAKAGFLPRADVASAYIGNNRGSFIALNGVREYLGLFQVGEEVDTSGRLRAVLSRARADREAAEAGVLLSGRDLKRAVTGAYYRLLLARRLVEVNQQSLTESRAFEARARLLAQGGEVARADVVKAASQAAFLEQAERAAELDAQIANYELASFWTAEVAEPLEVEDVLENSLPPPESPPFLRRLEFNLLEAQRKGFLADARAARAQLYPQLSLVFQYGLDASRVAWPERGYAAFVNLHIPVFDWFKSRNQAQQAELRARQVEANREIATRTFSKEYQSALARVKRIYEQIGMTVEQVRLSEENLKLSRVRYEGGEGSALDVVAAQQQLTQARSNRYAAVAAYLTARADLEVASGR
jgi:outer membrane protein TolC